MLNSAGIWEQIAGWASDDRKNCLMKGADKVRLEQCLDDENRIHCMRSVPDHSGGLPINENLQNNVQILF